MIPPSLFQDSAQEMGRGQGGGAGSKAPATGDFACTTCSKEYKSAETLQVHIEAHKKVFRLLATVRA